MRTLAEDWSLPAEALCLEITESVVVNDPELARRSLDQLRSIWPSTISEQAAKLAELGYQLAQGRPQVAGMLHARLTAAKDVWHRGVAEAPDIQSVLYAHGENRWLRVSIPDRIDPRDNRYKEPFHVSCPRPARGQPDRHG